MKNIFIVEDDIFLLQMYTVKFMESGFIVESAKDGEEAFKKLKDMDPSKVDLVLLDLVLPKMDGFELLKYIRKDDKLKNLKIIAFTNLGQKEEIKKALDYGANDYLIKAHFTPTEVVAKVREIVE